MKIFKKIIILFIIQLFCVNAYAGNNVRNLIIYAEPNLFVALTKIARIYSQKNAINVTVNFNTSVDFIEEIDSGEPADIFISAHPLWIETLRQKGLIDVYNIGYIADDQLKLITSSSNFEIPNKLNARNSINEALSLLDQDKNNLIINHEGTSSGYFAKNLLKDQVFENINVFIKIPEDKNSIITDLLKDKKNYGLAFESEIRNNKDIKIIASIKDNSILYRVLIIAGDNMENAREFLKFLKTNQAKKILKESHLNVD
jgi:molybdate transport system substrate-binding protein